VSCPSFVVRLGVVTSQCRDPLGVVYVSAGQIASRAERLGFAFCAPLSPGAAVTSEAEHADERGEEPG